jgi:hypothetical protein
MIIQDPTNNLMAAKQILYKKIMPSLTDDEIEQIITPTQSPDASVPEGVPMNEQDLSGMVQETPAEEGAMNGLQIQ